MTSLRLARTLPLGSAVAVFAIGCGGSLATHDGSGVAADSGGGSVVQPDAGSDASDAAPSDGFVLATYTRCAEGTHSDGGFLDSGGFAEGATLTLNQTGEGFSATYADQNGAPQSFAFAPTTSASATFTTAGQVVTGFARSCTGGPGDSWLAPASMSASSGAMTTNGGAVFVTLAGTIANPAGACGAADPGSPASAGALWVICQDPQGEIALAGGGGIGSSPPPQLPVGQYTCTSQVETHEQVNAESEDFANGGQGTLTLTQNGTDVTAQYTGDSTLAGTMHLTAATSTTATAGDGETLSAACMLSTTTTPFPIAAGSLSVAGSTLFLSFAGATDQSSVCPGAQIAGTLVCSEV